MTTANKNTLRLKQRRAQQQKRNLEAFERGDAEIKPLDEAAKSGLYRVLRAADKHITKPRPGFVRFRKTKLCGNHR
jgi:hypothetical protein